MKVLIAISLVALIVLLIQNKYRVSLLFASLASIYFVLDLVSFEAMVSGFVNNSLLVLVLIVIASIALEKTILMEFFSKMIISKSYQKTYLRLGVIIPAFSAFLNNTAVVASLMGVIKNNKHHYPSKLLIPLSFLSILGGTTTLVGTAPNLLVNSFVVENGHESLKIFDFFYVGIIIVFFGVIALYFSKNLLPENKTSIEDNEEYLLELKVLPTSTLISKTIKDNGLRHLESLFLVEIIRGSKKISPVGPDETIEAEDRLVFSGDIKCLDLLKRFDGLVLTEDKDIKKTNLVDVVISPSSSLIGKKVKESNFRSKYDSAIVSFKRGSENILKIGEETIQAGDRMILAVGKEFKYRENIAKNFYILSDIEKESKYDLKSSIFIVLGFMSVIGFSAMGYISLFKALVIYLTFLLLFRVLSIAEIKRRFPYEIYIIIGSSLAISKVLVSSGLANDLAMVITSTLGSFGVYGSFIGIYLVTMLLTEFMSNNAAAAIVFPIAYATALALDASIYPFVFAVAYGASASFLIPYGYQTNLMVSSVGGYKTTDFIKTGAILSIVYSLVVIIFVPIFFKF
jgi:di/tricarboxylate transporter